jgi:hypothetical protein
MSSFDARVDNAVSFLKAYNPKELDELRGRFGGLRLRDFGVDTTITAESVSPSIAPSTAMEVEKASLRTAIQLSEKVLKGLQDRLRAQRYIDLTLNFLGLFSSGGTIGTLLAGKASYATILACVSVFVAILGLVNKFLSRGKDYSAESQDFRDAAGTLFEAKRILDLLGALDPQDPRVSDLCQQADSLAKSMIDFAASYDVAPL